MGRSRKRRAASEPPPKQQLVRFRDPRSPLIVIAGSAGTVVGAVIGAVAAGPVGAIAVGYFVLIGCVLVLTRLEKAARRRGD